MGKELFVAVATLVGFVVGAGILGLPYVFAQSGFLTGVLSVLFIGITVLILNLMIGETSLRTKSSHQLVGYAERYLGKKGKKLMLIFLLLGWYGAMVAYIIKTGQFLSALLDPIIIINPVYYSIIFALLGSFLVYRGLSLIEKSEFWMVTFIFIIIAIIAIFTAPQINTSNLTTFNLNQFWFPFGVVLFAFGGAGAIPEMREELKNNKKLIKKAIIIGTIISALIYILFPILIVGVTGLNTTDGAILGLGQVLGYKILALGSLFGILTMTTSFIAIGLAIKEIFKFDYRDNEIQSSFLATVIPFTTAIIIILLKIDNAFYKVIDLNGAIIYPLTSILFVIMFWRARKMGNRKPEYTLKFAKTLGVIVILIFLLGFINEMVKLFF
jgi:amino acid permease